MSRIAKKPIKITSGVKASVSEGADDNLFKVTGPLGENQRHFRKDVKIDISDEGISIVPTKEDSLELKALWGTYASHVKNMIKGVAEGFKKVLQIEGIGFKTQLSGNKMVWNLGFSHPVEVEVPKNLKVAVEKNIVTISGIDKEAVGQFAAQLVSMKPPEPYKGKGIRYEGQVIRTKEGKKSVT